MIQFARRKRKACTREKRVDGNPFGPRTRAEEGRRLVYIERDKKQKDENERAVTHLSVTFTSLKSFTTPSTRSYFGHARSEHSNTGESVFKHRIDMFLEARCSLLSTGER